MHGDQNNCLETQFDSITDRRGTNCIKWDCRQELFGKDVVPLWIADMDFPAPPAVIDCLRKRLEHPFLAYNTLDSALLGSFIDWVRRRFGWTIESDWILVAPGVVPSIALSILALTEPGDAVIIQPPVYPPFFEAIRDNKRIALENPLVLRDGYYQIDFDDLEAKLSLPNSRALLLCSPHNPVGRVWNQEELGRILELCARHNVVLLSDEIHADIIIGSRGHKIAGSLPSRMTERTVTFMAASKTFNLAGLNLSFVIAPGKNQRTKISHWFKRLHISRPNLLGSIAVTAAYSNAEAWLEQCLKYLQRNAELLKQFVIERLPGVRIYPMEGTYLAWLDFRERFADPYKLERFLIDKAGVGLSMGKAFGKQGECFARLNYATQRSVLSAALEHIAAAL